MGFRPGRYVVTGGASGIGAAVARELTEAGCSLLLLDRDRAGLERTGGELDAEWRPIDVVDGEALDTLAGEFADGGIAGLVNAAGLVQLGTIRDVDEGDWDRVVDVNLKGTYLACRAFIPLLSAGAIVNLASVSGRTKSIYSAPNYVASKAGVIGLTMVLAAQHATEGIRVNCVAPGIIETPMLAGYSAEQREVMRAAVPLGRIGTAGEVAEVVAFLLSEGASYVTGQTVNVNGGQFMQ